MEANLKFYSLRPYCSKIWYIYAKKIEIVLITFSSLFTQTGRAQPHKDDREEFYKSLKSCASGKMSLQMLYFFKYLLKHSEEDNMPLIDKDLFFYIEVQKFKVSLFILISLKPNDSDCWCSIKPLWKKWYWYLTQNLWSEKGAWQKAFIIPIS